MMDYDEIIDILKIWELHFGRIEKVRSELGALFGNCVECRFWSVIDDVFSQYTDAIGSVIGDDFSWMDWFCWENDMGKKKLQASYDKGRKMKAIVTISDLADLITESRD